MCDLRGAEWEGPSRETVQLWEKVHDREVSGMRDGSRSEFLLDVNMKKGKRACKEQIKTETMNCGGWGYRMSCAW